MSLKYYTKVWQESPQAKTRLLLLLALADVADEDGVCWPGAEFLAEMIRTEINEDGKRSIRNIYRMTAAMEKEGEIWINKRDGKVNRYIICTDRTNEDIADTMNRRFGIELDIAFELASIVVDLQQRTSDKLSRVSHESPTRDIAMSPDPSLTDLINTSVRDTEEYRDLLNAVVGACKRLNALAISDADNEQIDILFAAGIREVDIRDHYAPEKWWYRIFWKGKKGQFPTPKDIVETVEMARASVIQGEIPDFNKAWREILSWLNGQLKVTEFTNPWTLEIVKTIGGDKLRTMSEFKSTQYRAFAADLWREKVNENQDEPAT